MSFEPQTSAPQAPSKVVKWAFVVGIMLLANLFVAYLTQALYPAPKWEDFCPASLHSKMITSSEQCGEIGGEWYADSMTANEYGGYCNSTAKCQKKFEAAHSVYSRDVFVVFVVFGTLLLAGSAFLSWGPVLALSASFAGVLALIIGSLWHWSDMQEWLRVAVLGVALAGVVYLAWKKFGRYVTD